MKKLVALSLITFLFLPAVVFAASIGGAETQGQGKFALGLDTDFTFKRDMKYKGGVDLGPGQELEDVNINKLYRIMLKTSYGLTDNLDFYLKLGMADVELKADFYEAGVKTGEIVHKGKDAFAYGLGLKGVYDFDNDWLFGYDLQYLRHKNKFLEEFTTVASGVTDEYEGETTFQEWHIAPYIAKRMGGFVPYFGVRYSDLRIKAKYDDGWKAKFGADDNFGGFAGADYKIGENLILNVEGRFINETALSIAANYKF